MTQLKTVLLLLSLLLASGLGCGTRVVYVKDGVPVRLREPLLNVKVWVRNADKVWVAGVQETIPEGWFCISFPKEK